MTEYGFSDNPSIDAGVKAGRDRALSNGFETSPEALFEDSQRLQNLIFPSLERVRERFLVLFVENATVAAIARDFYGEPPLDNEELMAFFEHLADFLNSFTHRHGD